MGAYVRGERKAFKQEAPRVLGYFPWLEARKHQQAGTLSGGEQQMLVARPCARLATATTDARRAVARAGADSGQGAVRIVKHLNAEEGLSVLVVEQNAKIALDASARAYVLEVGKIAVAGTSDELRRHEGVRSRTSATSGGHSSSRS